MMHLTPILPEFHTSQATCSAQSQLRSRAANRTCSTIAQQVVREFVQLCQNTTAAAHSITGPTHRPVQDGCPLGCMAQTKSYSETAVQNYCTA